MQRSVGSTVLWNYRRCLQKGKREWEEHFSYILTDPSGLPGLIKTDLIKGTNKYDGPSISLKDSRIARFVRLQLVVDVP